MTEPMTTAAERAATRAEIIERHARGESLSEIARAIRRTRTGVRYILRVAGVPLVDDPRVPPAVLEAFRAMYAAGATDRELCAHFKRTTSTLMRWRAILGIRPRPPFTKKWKDAWTATALEMKRKGRSWPEIGKRFGVSRDVPRKYVEREIRSGRMRV